ncbi:MAG: transporter substrate-binding domain-containing protein [Gammaproteobacteria bacterium]
MYLKFIAMRARPAIYLIASVLASATGMVSPVEAGQTIIIGTHEAPPFVVRNSDGTFSGISIELWEIIAGQLDLDYEIREMELRELLQGLQNGSVDVAAGALTVTAERVKTIDFSHPFFTSGLGIALIQNKGDKLESAIKAVFSIRFLQALAALVALLLVVALLIWLFERKSNPKQFNGKPHRGVGDGFWWAAVTMTTVGFGDKAPVTFWGRLLAIVWMFASVITISGFTAAIASVFTLQEIEGHIQGPQDLEDIVNGTVKDTTSSHYAANHQLHTVLYKNVAAALDGLANREVDAVVYDAPILNYLAHLKPEEHITVLPNTFMRQDYAFGLPERSPLREKINAVLLEQIATEQWKTMLSYYLGNKILEKF